MWGEGKGTEFGRHSALAMEMCDEFEPVAGPMQGSAALSTPVTLPVAGIEEAKKTKPAIEANIEPSTRIVRGV